MCVFVPSHLELRHHPRPNQVLKKLRATRPPAVVFASEEELWSPHEDGNTIQLASPSGSQLVSPSMVQPGQWTDEPAMQPPTSQVVKLDTDTDTRHQVRFCRDRFSASGDLGYRGVRGAVGLGYKFTVSAFPCCYF